MNIPPKYRWFILLTFLKLSEGVQYTYEERLQIEVNGLSNRLKQYSSNKLGVEKLQKYFNEITTSDGNNQNIVGEFQKGLNRKIQNAKKSIKPIKEFITQSHKATKNRETTNIQSCCTYNKDLEFNYLFNASVNFEDVCEYTPTKCSAPLPMSAFNKDSRDQITKLMKEQFNIHGKGFSRHFYYGDKNGYFIAYPAQKTDREICHCRAFDPRFRPWYIDAINANIGKEIIIVADFSSRMEIMKNHLRMLTKQLLNVADARDKIYLQILPKVNAVKPQGLDCLNGLVDANTAIKNEMKKLIDNTTIGDNLQSLHLDEAFGKFKDESGKEKVFILVTSGDYDDYSQVKEQFTKFVTCKVSVNIFLLSGTAGVTTRVHNFHKDLIDSACENNQKRNQLIEQKISRDDEVDILDINSYVVKVFDSFYMSMQEREKSSSNTNDDGVEFVMPYEDFYGLGTMVDACTRVMSEEKEFLGVFCMSFLKNELFGVTTEFEENNYQYRFLIDETGTTFVHPKYVDPKLHELAIRFDIRTFETSENFKEIYASMKRGETNQKRLSTKVPVRRGLFGVTFEDINFTYYWQKVTNSPFSVGVAISDEYQTRLKFKNLDSTGGRDVYHRYINSQSGNILATNQTSVIKLPSSAFKQPTNESEALESIERVETLMNYINGIEKAHPDFLQGNELAKLLKNDILATRYINNAWLNTSTRGIEQNLTINKRYIGLNSGVFRIYPGERLPTSYNPTTKKWYQIAQICTSERTLFFMPPFSEGSKKLLTISETLKKNYGDLQQPTGAIAMDFELSYFKNMLTPACSESENTCIVLSRSGFIIYHPDFLNGGGTIPRNLHIFDKEPNIANEMVAKKIMRKSNHTEYNNLAPKLIQFYELETVPKVKKIESSCLLFWIVSIPATNLMLLNIKTSETCTSFQDCTCTSQNGDLVKCNLFNNHCDCPCYKEEICFSEDLIRFEEPCRYTNDKRKCIDVHLPEGRSDETKQSLSTGTYVGIIISCVIVVVLLSVFAVVISKKRLTAVRVSKKKNSNHNVEDKKTPAYEDATYYHGKETIAF